MRMSWMAWMRIAVCAVGLWAPSLRALSDEPEFPTFIAPESRQAIQSWIAAHPEYRLAVDEDCACDDDIGPSNARQIHPYFATGDFDDDGIRDFGIVALPKREGLKILVVVFFGTRAGFDKDVSEISLPYSRVTDAGLFVGKSVKKGKSPHDELGYGAFESEWEPLPVTRHKS